MYVLDTNILIYFFKEMGQVAKRLLELPPQEIAIPAIVLYELEVGLAKSMAPEKRQAQLGQLLAVISVLPGIHLSRDILQADRRGVYLGAPASPPAF